MNAPAIPGSNASGLPTTPMRLPISRNIVIAASVVIFHVAALWALQNGLLMRAVEVVVPATVLAEFIEPPAPKVEPPAPPAPPAPEKKVVVKPKAPVLPAPRPLAIADSVPSPNAPVSVMTSQPLSLPAAASVAVAPTAPPAPPLVQLPLSNADYLQNPKPPYPALSKRFNEQGTTVLKVWIDANGLPQRSQVLTSSGFHRLDQAAAAATMRWRYVPGKRGGVPEAMPVEVPIVWVLD